MAIKVNGTTVIDDSRNLVNIVSGAGSSTTLADVGTYAFMRAALNYGEWAAGTTVSAASVTLLYSDVYNNSSGAPGVGTWRSMGHADPSNSATLWVRIA